MRDLLGFLFIRVYSPHLWHGVWGGHEAWVWCAATNVALATHAPVCGMGHGARGMGLVCGD